MANDGRLLLGRRVLNEVNVAEVPVAVANLVEVDGSVGFGWRIPGDPDSPGVVELVYSDLPGSASGHVPEGLVDDGL